ncbi:MAG: hypothetical protein GY930_03380 [bacterium]|nr:hypothetical protein [bacterium]
MADYQDWRSDAIPPEIFRDWLRGKYLLGARKSTANEVLGWCLMLRGVYHYSVYIPSSSSGIKDAPPKLCKRAHKNFTNKEKWECLHSGYGHMRIDGGELVLQGVRIYTPSINRNEFHSPIFWTSTLTKLETRKRHKSSKAEAQASFTYKVASPTDQDSTVYCGAFEKEIAKKCFSKYKNVALRTDGKWGSKFPDPYSLAGDGSDVPLLDYLRSEEFPEHIAAFHEGDNTLYGLALIDLNHPDSQRKANEPRRAKRRNFWTLTGQYQQMRLGQGGGGEWGQIYFTRVGGLRHSKGKMSL